MKKILFSILLIFNLLAAQAIVITNPNGRPVNWQQLFTNQQAMLGILECLITGFDSTGNYSVINRIWVQNDSLFISKMDSIIFITKTSDFEKSGPENNTTYSIASGGTEFSINKNVTIGESEVYFTGFLWQDSTIGTSTITGLIKLPGFLDTLYHPGTVYFSEDQLLVEMLTYDEEGGVQKLFLHQNTVSPWVLFQGKDGISIVQGAEGTNLPDYPFQIIADNAKYFNINNTGNITHNGAYVNTGVVIDTIGIFTIQGDISHYVVKADTSFSVVIGSGTITNGQEVTILFENTADSGLVASSITFIAAPGFTFIGDTAITSASTGQAIRAKRIGNKIYVYK